MNTVVRNTAFAIAVLAVVFAAQPGIAAETELAQARAPRLDMLIDARCEGSTAVFRMKNRGNMWPKTGVLMVMTHDGEQVLHEREMRFAINQTATVRYLKAAKYPAGVTLYIRPRWEDRGYGSGVRLRCN